MKENYITIMIESLQNKVGILDSIIQKNEEQTKILQSENTDWDAFDRNADEKSELIEKMDKLDVGFDQLFAKVENELSSAEGKQQYKTQIHKMQDLITKITEKSVSIQRVEARNKQLVEKRFTESHQRFGQSRSTSRVAMDYYKNMQQTHIVSAAFLDQKK